MRTGRLFLLERQGDLRDELRGVLVLRRAFEINASERPLGREPMLPRVGAELFLCGGQVLVGPVVVETERRRRGQRLDILTRAPRRDGRAGRNLAGSRDGRLHKVHPLCDVRAVEPHRLQRGGVEQRRVLRQRRRRIHAAVDRLPRQKNAPDLRRRCCWQCRCCE